MQLYGPSWLEKTDVDAYIARAPEYARPICNQLRALIRRAAPKLSETLKWSSPAYVGRGLVCGFAAFKEHLRLFFFKGAHLSAAEGLLKPGDKYATARAIKIMPEDKLPVKALERLVREAAKLDASVEVKPTPRVKRPELPVPDDLASEIQKSTMASANWEKLPPSCRREYIEWITSAKREETREKRLATAVDMITDGQRRDEKYRK